MFFSSKLSNYETDETYDSSNFYFKFNVIYRVDVRKDVTVFN